MHALLLTAMLGASSAYPGLYPDAEFSLSGPAAGDIDMLGYGILNLDDLYGEAPTSDVAPRVTVLGTQPIYVVPGATNVTGANLMLAPSPGERTLEGVTRAGTTGDTLTFDVYSNGVVTQTVKTEGASSPNGWDCDGAASDPECVCNLYTLLTGAGAITGVTVTRTDATCSDEKLTFTITPGVAEYLTVVTSDDTNLDMTIGVSGTILLVDGSANYPAIGWAADNDGTGSGLYRVAADRWGLSSNGGLKFDCGPTACTLWTTLNTTSRIYSSGAALVFGGIYSPIKGGVSGSVAFGKDAGDGISWEAEGIGHQLGNLYTYSLLDTGGGRVINVTTVNDTNYTVLTGDHLVAYTALTAARTVTLPDALCADGRTFDIKDEAGAAGTWNITIDPEGGTTIDGQATVLIDADYNSLTVYCRGSAWFTR